MGLFRKMTPTGAIELPLLVAQLATSFLATWAGIRVVDDIRHWRSLRAQRVRSHD